jgi:hypothetical protein
MKTENLPPRNRYNFPVRSGTALLLMSSNGNLLGFPGFRVVALCYRIKKFLKVSDQKKLFTLTLQLTGIKPPTVFTF